MKKFFLLESLLFVALFVFAMESFSQHDENQYVFWNYGDEYGLYNPDVSDFEQDSVGFLWFATFDGLYRYDGQYFDLFDHEPYDTLSIPDNKVTALTYDTIDNALWVGTYFGELSQLNLSSYKFINKPAIPNINSFEHNSEITCIKRYNDEWVLIGTFGSGLYFYNVKSNTYVQSSKFGKQFTRINDWVLYRNIMYLATEQGVYALFKDENNEFKFSGVRGLEHIKPVLSLEINNNILSLISLHQLYAFDLHNLELNMVYENRGSRVFNTHYIDEIGSYWIGTNGSGIFHVSANGHVNNHYRANEESDFQLQSNWINDIYMSPLQSIIWVGAKGSLSAIDKHQYKFRQQLIDTSENKAADRIYFIYQDKNRTRWYYSTHGTFRKNHNDENCTLLELDNPKRKITERIYQAYEQTDMLWLASELGLIKVNLETDDSQLIAFNELEASSVGLSLITGMQSCNDSLLWLASHKGLIKYNTVSSNYKVYPFEVSELGMDSIQTNKLCVLNDSIILLGTNESLMLKFNYERESYKVIPTQRQFGDLIKKNFVLDIVKDRNNNVWLATYGSGLMQYFVETDSVAQASTNSYLASDVYGILEGDDGMLWMSTTSKLIRFNPDNKKVTVFGKRDGIKVKEFNECAYSRTADGQLLFGGFGGFIEFIPSELHYNINQPKVEITSYTLNSKVYKEDNPGEINVDYHVPDTIVISTNEKKASFYASVFSYAQSYKNLAAWKLEGYESEWDTLPAYSEKSYGRLPEGKYELKLKGSNNDEVWSESYDSVIVIVKPAFFDSRLFKVLLAIFVVLIFYLFYTMRVRILTKRGKKLQSLIDQSVKKLKRTNDDLEQSKEEVLVQKEELERHRLYLEELVLERTSDLQLATEKAEESDKLKTAFLANLSHEIRTPMNSIIGFSTLLASDEQTVEERKKFSELVLQSSESLLVLIDDIIDISRIESGQIQLIKKHFDLKEICDFVNSSLLLQNKNKHVNLTMNLDGIQEKSIIYSDAERLKQILINLLNNGIKYTKEGTVNLQVRHQKREDIIDVNSEISRRKLPASFYLFQIEDTGVGIDEKDFKNIFNPFTKVECLDNNYGGMGLGLSIVKQLIHLLDGEIWLESELNVGTTFYFYLPDFDLK